MSENTFDTIKEQQRGLLIDPEAGERYDYIVTMGIRRFANTSLTNSSTPITESDVTLVDAFHVDVSPQNLNHPWRLRQTNRTVSEGYIADPSYFSNWEQPGGTLEHMRLATMASQIILFELRDHSKAIDEVTEDWMKNAIRAIQTIDPNHVAVAAGLHDEGRQVTQLFYSNELIGVALLKKIGIRNDILQVLPDEKVLQIPLEENMDNYIQGMNPEKIIVSLADDCGKRKGNTNHLWRWEDFTQEMQVVWADAQLKKNTSGRPSDRKARSIMALHTANSERYMQALDLWVESVSTTTLSDISRVLDDRLSKTLFPIVS